MAACGESNSFGWILKDAALSSLTVTRCAQKKKVKVRPERKVTYLEPGDVTLFPNSFYSIYQFSSDITSNITISANTSRSKLGDQMVIFMVCHNSSTVTFDPSFIYWQCGVPLPVYLPVGNTNAVFSFDGEFWVNGQDNC